VTGQEMVNNRRSEFEIIYKILSLSRNNVKKTEILYQGNLSFTQLQNYLPFLIEKNMLEENVTNNNSSSFKSYKITDKGLNLLTDIERVLTKLE
jgi:predicted transcriptional regulator